MNVHRWKRLLVSRPDLKVHVGDASVNVLNINFEPPVPLRYFTPHTHSSHELHFIPDGYGTLRVHGRSYRIEPGTLYLTGPGVLHEQIADEAAPMAEYCLNFELLPQRASAKKPSGDPLHHIFSSTDFWFGRDHTDTWRLLEEILSELEQPGAGHANVVHALSSLVLVRVARLFSENPPALHTLPDKQANDRRRAEADNFFRQSQSALKPDSLASLLGVSSRQLERIMRQMYGMTFSEKLRMTRLSLARDLLVSTDLSVAGIAQQTGFSSTNYFCRQFSASEGCSPGQYRRQKRTE